MRWSSLRGILLIAVAALVLVAGGAPPASAFAPAVAVEKVGSPAAQVGDPVSYAFFIDNTGDITLFKQDISDTLLGDITIVGVDQANPFVTENTCGASLAASTSCIITATRTVQEGDPDPLTNTVEVVYNSQANLQGVEVSDSASHSVDILQPADSDGDGIPDAEDACPDTDPEETVDANGCTQGQAKKAAKEAGDPSISDGFDYPVSSVFRPTRAFGDSDGWSALNNFGHFLASPPCTAHYHPGDDWNRDDGKDAGETVRAVSNGKVVAVKQNMKNAAKVKLGDMVVISHIIDDQTVYSVYVHVEKNNAITKGVNVARGQPIGVIGSFGFGPHLHFEMRTFFNTKDAYPNDDGCGYYVDQDTMLSDGFIDPVEFIDGHRPQ